MLHMSDLSWNNSWEVLPNCFLPRQTIKVEAFSQWWLAFKPLNTTQNRPNNPCKPAEFRQNCRLPVIQAHPCGELPLHCGGPWIQDYLNKGHRKKPMCVSRMCTADQFIIITTMHLTTSCTKVIVVCMDWSALGALYASLNPSSTILAL